MKYLVLMLAILLTASGGNPASAYYCEGGQQPVPAVAAEAMALPLCGFAATEDFGVNGCQLCDSRNMYPNPFAAPEVFDFSAAKPNVHRSRGGPKSTY